MPTHRDIDLRSLAMHRIVADKVLRDQSLLDEARVTLHHWYQTVSPRTFVYLDEWQSLLDQGVEACVRVVTEDSEHAAALRQASPMACLLSSKERFAFLKAWKAQHAPQ